jgi:membrane-associated phospholipid phosphatase
MTGQSVLRVRIHPALPTSLRFEAFSRGSAQTVHLSITRTWSRAHGALFESARGLSCAPGCRHRRCNSRQGHVVGRASAAAAWMVVPEKGWEFPSGHATRSAAVYGSVGHLAIRCRAVGRRAHAAVWMIAIPVSFLVGISRVYLGVRWPADAIGGWILATAWLWVALLAPPL